MTIKTLWSQSCGVIFKHKSLLIQLGLSSFMSLVSLRWSTLLLKGIGCIIVFYMYPQISGGSRIFYREGSGDKSKILCVLKTSLRVIKVACQHFFLAPENSKLFCVHSYPCLFYKVNRMFVPMLAVSQLTEYIETYHVKYVICQISLDVL